MGDRQKTRLAERRKRQRQRQRARTERVKSRNERVSDVAAATGTRAGEAWAGTVDNLVNQAADIAGDYLAGDDADAANLDMVNDAIDDGAGAVTPPPPPSGGGFDPVAWATENPLPAAGVAIAGAGLLGLATGLIKLPK